MYFFMAAGLLHYSMAASPSDDSATTMLKENEDSGQFHSVPSMTVMKMRSTWNTMIGMMVKKENEAVLQ